MKRVIFVLALLAIATTGTAFAQIQGGTISGTVRDEQGGVLPGVTVTAQGVDATQTFITEATGELHIASLISLGLVLFIITFAVLALARLLIGRQQTL